jgi:hypothetical protein
MALLRLGLRSDGGRQRTLLSTLAARLGAIQQRETFNGQGLWLLII